MKTNKDDFKINHYRDIFIHDTLIHDICIRESILDNPYTIKKSHINYIQ